MHDLLIQSIQALQKSKYRKGNKNKLISIQNALKLANPLFVSSNQNNGKSNKIINFRNMDQTEQIPKI